MDAMDFVDAVERSYRSGDYVSALTTIAAAEAEGKTTVELLLLKAACIQLSENTDFPLRRALSIYEFVLRHRPKHSRALAEAGYFMLNVEDNPVGAQKFFSAAADVEAEALRESIVGLAKASLEAGSTEERVKAEILETLEQLRLAIFRHLAVREPRQSS